ncbi:hypothetical protein [Roseateles aquatilis]|nr:hypothetical protein [Roseateles aquatilis]
MPSPPTHDPEAEEARTIAAKLSHAAKPPTLDPGAADARREAAARAQAQQAALTRSLEKARGDVAKSATVARASSESALNIGASSSATSTSIRRAATTGDLTASGDRSASAPGPVAREMRSLFQALYVKKDPVGLEKRIEVHMQPLVDRIRQHHRNLPPEERAKTTEAEYVLRALVRSAGSAAASLPPQEQARLATLVTQSGGSFDLARRAHGTMLEELSQLAGSDRLDASAVSRRLKDVTRRQETLNYVLVAMERAARSSESDA